MRDRIEQSNDELLNLHAIHDELGRVPVIGPGSDRELYLDLPSAGLATPHTAGFQPAVEREFLANDFSHGS